MASKQTVDQRRAPAPASAAPVAALTALAARHSTALMLIGVLLLSFIAWRPLLQPAFPVTWDGDLHVIRLLHLERELKAGQFPVRWGSEQNGGYGYPTFNFYYQLPYYAGVALHQLGLTAAESLKALVGLSFVIGALATALWVRNVWGPLGGLVAGVAAVLAPSLLQTAYLVGAVGELVAIGFVPPMLLALERASRHRRPHLLWYLVAALVLAATILSHNLFGIFAVGIALSYAVALAIGARDRWPVIASALATILALGLTAYFWLPGVLELPNTYSVRPIDIRFGPPLELLDVSIGTPTVIDRQIFRQVFPRDTLGPAIIGSIVIASTTLVALRGRLSRTQLWHLVFCLVLVAGILFLMVMPFRSQVWRSLPLLEHAQYASRLLLIAGLFGAAIAGSLAVWRKWGTTIAVVLVAVAVVYGLGFGRTANTQPLADSYYRHYWQQYLGAADWGAPIMPRWNRFGELPPTRTIATVEGRGTVIEADKRSTDIRAVVRMEEPAIVRFSTLYFPGWTATLDGVETQIDIKSDTGAIGVETPPGEHVLALAFRNTLPRTAGNAASVASALLIAGLFVAAVLTRRRGPMD
jgi:hypothetical protein